MRRWRDLHSATKRRCRWPARSSGGERLRAGLACVFADPQPPLMLLLDEPTNHLDLAAIEELESALGNYDGALIVVSHDQTFLQRDRDRARDRALTKTLIAVLQRRPRRRIGDLRRQRKRRRQPRFRRGTRRRLDLDRRRQRGDLRLVGDGCGRDRRRRDRRGRRQRRSAARSTWAVAAGDADRGRAAAGSPARVAVAASGPSGAPPRQRDRGRRRRRRLAALDRIKPPGFAIDRPHREPGRQRRHIDGAVERVGRAHREQLDFGTAGRGDRGRGDRHADVGLMGRNV